MPRDIDYSDRMETINTIADQYLLKGVNNPTKIAKDLGMKRAEVVAYIEEWKAYASNSDGVKERAAELLTEMDLSYDQIIKELWNAHADSTTPRDTATILKTIADVIAKRHEVMKQAGLYDDAALGQNLAVAEEQAQKIGDLLKTISMRYPETRSDIMRGLAEIFGKVDPIPVQEDMHLTP